MTRAPVLRRGLPWLAGVVCLFPCAASLYARQVQTTPQRPTVQAPSSPAGSATPSGAISGVVVDAVTNRPVAGAVVSLANLDNRLAVFPRMVTDARGRFVFRQLDASKGYYLGARRFGYAYTRYGWTAPGQSLTINDIARITLAEGQWLSNISIPLWQLGAINGRVVDERGEPVVGVAVRVFTTRTVSGHPQLVAGPIATTDDRGVYRIADLDPGKYVVAVLSVQSTVLATTEERPIARAVGELATGGIGAGRGSSVSAPGIDVDAKHRLVVTNFATPPPPSAAAARAYPAIFHPAARQPTDALPIEIGYRDNKSGVDFQLQPVPAVRVSGRLILNGLPVPRLLLRLLPAGSERLGFGSEAGTTLVDVDGSFTFLNIPQGAYTLMAHTSVMDFTSGSNSVRFPDAPGFPAAGISVGSFDGARGLEYLARSGPPSALWARMAVTVGATDIDDLDVPMQRAVTVRGRIVFEPGSRGEPRVSLTAEPADGDPTLGQLRGTTAPNDPSLAFAIEGLIAGRYLLRPLSSYGIVSVMSAGRDTRDTGFDASSGRDIDDVVVTLTDKLAAIQGTVHGRPGLVTAVIAFPAERQQWTNFGWRPPRFRTTRAGLGGSFQLTGLPAGEYFLVAVDPSQNDSWNDPRFLEAAAARATRVTLAWGDKKTQDLTFAEVVVK